LVSRWEELTLAAPGGCANCSSDVCWTSGACGSIVRLITLSIRIRIAAAFLARGPHGRQLEQQARTEPSENAGQLAEVRERFRGSV